MCRPPVLTAVTAAFALSTKTTIEKSAGSTMNAAEKTFCSELKKSLPAAWKNLLSQYIESASFEKLADFIESEYHAYPGSIFPPQENIFAALETTLPDTIKAVILGQDPYHEKGQAHGFAFSVPAGTKLPPSLKNIFKEYCDDTGFEAPECGDLRQWAKRGVLLLNTVMTVREGTAASHRNCGWELFTDEVIKAIDSLNHPLVFLLWGSHAQAKESLIRNHAVIKAPHPSPLSAYRGFFGSKPFSKINHILAEASAGTVDWHLIREETDL
jgi:uracil-DNA glycosylase